MFGAIFDFIVGWFTPSYERDPSFEVDFQAYKDAWRKREHTGDESESLLSDELEKSSIYKSSSEYPPLLYDGALTRSYSARPASGRA